MGGGGFEDHGVIVGDWMPPSSSSRSLFSSMAGKESWLYVQGPEGHCDPSKPLTGASAPADGPSDSNTPIEPRTSSRVGSLMERRAARAGFNAPSLNTDTIRHGDLSKEQHQSPYLTIPPGLSPTTLLDSPVFLANSLVQPSPTTGKFPFASGCTKTSMTRDEFDKCEEDSFEGNTSFAFEQVVGSKSVSNVNAVNGEYALGSFTSFGISTQPDTSLPHQTASSPAEKNTSISDNLSPPENTSLPLDDPPPPNTGVDPTAPNAAGETPAEDDGYNWRKYGQKQVKGSDYPRSYYKCTHPNCPVKKKVERSHEGHVTEIIYKGAHTHPKPSPSHPPPSEGGTAASEPGPEDHHVWKGVQGYPEVMAYRDGPNQGAWDGDSARCEPGVHGSVEGSSTFSMEDNDDDRATHESVSLGYDGERDESDLKRRRMEAYASEVSGATRAIREPRVVVQTTSEVDILDDGYRWRKYGQKVVKGNPNPRSYYKCTRPGCNVRKHVERASHDLKSVITTYEGKHNHDIPVARNTGQHIPIPRGHVQRPEPPSKMHAAMARFDRPVLTPFGPPGNPHLLGPGFGYGLSQQRFPLPVMQVHPYLGYGPQPMSDIGGFVMPKTEPKVEPAMDVDSAVYQQLMSRYPLGP